MQLTSRIITLNKRRPFTISRGTRKESRNVFVFLHDGQYTGIGEFDASTLGDKPENAAEPTMASLQRFTAEHDLSALSIHEIWQLARDAGLPANALSGLDVALWDLLGKQCGKPCYQIFGLSRRSPPTSITIGITPIDMIPERIQELLGNHNFHSLKIKLGSSDGIEFDQQAFQAIKKAAKPYQVHLRVDANGGWTLSQAKHMCEWLSRQGVDYVEQPLPANCDEQLPELFKNRPLPIFVDESCHFSTDIARLSHCVDGVNVKLMKCGGLTEAMRMVATARAHRLKTMIGCMSESSVAISAASSIGSLFDYIDLDSHLNLDPDPARGSELNEGVILPLTLPGHGANLC